MRIIILLLSLLLFYSCQNTSTDEESIVSLKLNDALSINRQDLEKVNVQTVSLIPLEVTENSLLGESCAIVGDSLKRIVLKEAGAIYVFDDKGNFLSSVNQRGEGPQQYYYILDASVDWETNCVYVFDFTSHKLLTYSLKDGGFVKSIQRKDINSLIRLENGNWITYMAPNDSLLYDLCVYGKNWNLIWGRKGTMPESEKDYFVLKNFYQSNGAVYVYENDTIFNVNEKGGLFPFYRIDKGKFTPPTEVLYDIKKKNERHKYIWGESFCFSSTHCFIQYYYNKCIYSDVWDITDETLCYRRISHSPSDNIGLPVRIKNKTIYVWPSFVKGNTFYCLLDEVTTMQLFPEKGEDVNPCILKFTLVPSYDSIQ